MTQINGFLSEWVPLLFAVLFFALGCFFVYRCLFPAHVRAVQGYWDWQNEVGHGTGMFAMVTMLAPMLLPVPHKVWAGVLGLGTVFFVARALTWGRKLPYNKTWWDWLHVGMLACMTVMFANLSNHPVVVFITGCFWFGFSVYYAYDTWLDLRSSKALDIGSSASHLSMGVMMFAMTIAPSLFMGHDMAPMAAIDAPADEESLRELIYHPQTTNMIFVWGGCRECAEEATNFDRLAKEICGTRLRFIRMDKNKAPQLCKELGISRYPVVLLIDKGVLASHRLERGITDQSILALISGTRR